MGGMPPISFAVASQNDWGPLDIVILRTLHCFVYAAVKNYMLVIGGLELGALGWAHGAHWIRVPCSRSL